MQKPELHLPPRRYEHELMTNRITALGLWPVPDSWAQALEKGTPEAIARVVEKEGHEQTLADIVETMEGQGYEFDRILRREQVVIGRVSEGRQHTAVARWRNEAAERATAARNVFHVGLLEVGAGAYELRRGVDGVMRLPINYTARGSTGPAARRTRGNCPGTAGEEQLKVARRKWLMNAGPPGREISNETSPGRDSINAHATAPATDRPRLRDYVARPASADTPLNPGQTTVCSTLAHRFALHVGAPARLRSAARPRVLSGRYRFRSSFRCF